jgi:fumarate reductase flavoprotein subunit
MNEEMNTRQTDAIVVGAGGSGMAAAITLADAGMRTAVFEKMPSAGGTTNFVEGVYAVESDMQYRNNIKVTCDEGFKQLMEYSHWRANAGLVRAIVGKSADTITWLEKMGVEFLGPTADFLGGPRVWHLFKGFGNLMMERLVADAESKGVKIHYNQAATRLLLDETGRISGVVTKGKNGETTHTAKAVIIATGGYADNEAWIKKYTGFDLGINLFQVIPQDKKGEGIEMAWSIGAAEEGIEVLLFNIGLPPRTIGPGDHMLGAVGQPTLWVNAGGKRFCDEGIIQNMIHTVNAVARQPGRYCYRIFDEETKHHWENRGGLNVGNYSPPAMPLSKLSEEIKAAIEKKSPYVFASDTIPGLADAIGVDRNTLTSTVADYNRFSDSGHDGEFGKEYTYLRPVRSPKFYAIKCFPDFLCTLGGIKVNETMEALDENARPIKGLYAVGCDAGGIYGDSYDLIASGIGSSFALNSGRIAGENAARYVKIS